MIGFVEKYRVKSELLFFLQYMLVNRSRHEDVDFSVLGWERFEGKR